jgi:hypothetical protein
LKKNQDTPWTRIFVEAATIVASILLAFAIDAWWQDRQIRVEEQEILAGLHTEFLANREILTRNLTANLRATQSLEDFLRMVQGSQPQDAKAIVRATIFDMRAPYTTDLGNGTLHALLSSGRLENLTSKNLRSLLTAWEGVIGEVSDDEANNSKMVFEIFIPYIVQENYSWVAIEQSSNDPPAIRRLLADETFRHLVMIRHEFKDHLSGEFEEAIAAADKIIAEIEESIE